MTTTKNLGATPSSRGGVALPSICPQQNSAPAPLRKYRNTPTVVDGIRFDSKAEAKRWQMLKLLERAGGIHELRRQEEWPLTVNRALVATMRPDFSYYENGILVLDDTKGMKPTADWLIKAKLLRALYPNVELRINGVRMP